MSVMKKAKKLSRAERLEIGILLKQGYSHRKVAEALERSPNTISYEVRTNGGREGYAALNANQYARTRLKDRRHQWQKIEANPDLKTYVIEGLGTHWNPDEIAGAMRREQTPFYASKTAIYDWLHSARGQRYCPLLYSKRYRRKKRRLKAKKTLIPNRVGIALRFLGADHRTRYRHFEADTIVGKKGTPGGLKVLQERKSRLVLAGKVETMRPEEHARVSKRLHESVETLSITFDNGIENRSHETSGVPTFFCDPYSSWQKGGVENANKMLRRYFPKGTDFSLVSQTEVDDAVFLINQKPRKILGYRSAFNVALKAGIIKSESVLIRG